MLTELEVGLPRSKPATVHTDEDTIDLVRKLAAHYPDTMIAGILSGRRTYRYLEDGHQALKVEYGPRSRPIAPRSNPMDSPMSL